MGSRYTSPERDRFRRGNYGRGRIRPAEVEDDAIQTEDGVDLHTETDVALERET